MKLNCKRIDFTYIPGEEIFNFPEESGLPFLFDVEEELTGDPAAMDAVGKMLDEAEKLAEKAKTAIKAALADEDSRYHSVVTFFMEFHRDDVGPDIAAELFPGTDPAKLSFAEMVDFLKLKRFGTGTSAWVTPTFIWIRRAGLCDILKRHWKLDLVTRTPKSLSTGAKRVFLCRSSGSASGSGQRTGGKPLPRWKQNCAR